MGNTPLHLRRDGELRGCTFSPPPLARGRACGKRLKSGFQTALRSPMKVTVKTFPSAHVRYPRRRTTEAEGSTAASAAEHRGETSSAASADEDSAEASSAALAEEEDADSRMLRRFQNLCIRKGGRRTRKEPDVSRAIAARANYVGADRPYM